MLTSGLPELVILLVWVVSIVLSVRLAGERGWSRLAWGLIALFAGPLAVLVLLVLPAAPWKG